MEKQHFFSLFQVYGVELEYMIVNKQTLDIKPIADILFQEISGKITSSIEEGELTLDNELALHVIEIKTTHPATTLDALATLFHNKIKEINGLLLKHSACLMPTAMHPWMDPLHETKLWPHGSSEIYNAFDAIFNCSGHGWGNLQSAHLNLPFGSEEEFVKLHQAIRIVLPLIPCIAASSPFVEGKLAKVKDKRLDVYQNNCKKIFSVTGHIIPEACASFEEYHTKILNKIYKDLSPLDPEKILQYEWVNARGAITRFERGSIEIRLIDLQENPYQDLAIIQALSSLIKHLMQGENSSLYDQFHEERLKRILLKNVVHGEEAIIDDREYLALFGLKAEKKTGRELWKHIICNLLEIAEEHKNALDLIIKEGTLATRLEKKVGDPVNLKLLHKVFYSLCGCLQQGVPFVP